MDPNAQNDSKQPQYIAGLIICLILLVISWTGRLYAQHKIGQLWALDNVLITIASILTVATFATCFISLRFGLGLHLMRVLAEDPDRPHNTVRITQTGYVVALLNCSAVNFIKFSILAFYRRVFTSNRARQRVFTYALWIVGVYTVLLAIASSVVITVQCLPIHYYWDPTPELNALAGHPEYPTRLGRCLPTAIAYGTPLIAGLLSDFVILALPAVGLWNLKMKRVQKVGIFTSFSFGIFACTIEILRVYFTFGVDESLDYTWVYTDSMMWAAIELSVAITCSCIPAMAPLLKRAHSGRRDHRGSKWSWALFGSQITSFKIRVRQMWSRGSQEDSESLREFTAI